MKWERSKDGSWHYLDHDADEACNGCIYPFKAGYVEAWTPDDRRRFGTLDEAKSWIESLT